MMYGGVLLDLLIYHWASENLPSHRADRLMSFIRMLERVARDTLATELELGKRMFIGRGEALAIKDGELPPRLLRGSTEALFGVAGLFSSYCRLYQLIDSCVQQVPARQGGGGALSHRSVLLEVSQGLGRGTPRYEDVMQSGPDHMKQFRVRVWTPDGKSAEGDGPSKKQAAESAACLS